MTQILSFQEQSAIKSLVQSEAEFPVDFDDAVVWIGWTSKQQGKQVLLNNFEEEQDFLRNGFKSPNGGRPSERINLTIDCFKQLSMLAGTDRGKEVRKYFLQCEKELKSQSTIPLQLPQTYLDALKALVASEEEKLVLVAQKEQLESQVQVLTPKGEVYDAIANAGTNLLIGELAKIFAIPNLGQNKLFAFLRTEGILMSRGFQKNLPYQQYIDRGYFVVIQKPRARQQKIDNVTLVTNPSGVQFILDRLSLRGFQLSKVA